MIRPERIAHVVIKVRDLARSTRFYQEVLGLEIMGTLERPPVSFLAANRRDHHEIGLVEVGERALDADPRSVGLVHIAFRLSTEEELRAAYAELKERDVPISFTVDHGVTKSVYFRDPDGNELEVYCDNSPEDYGRLPNPYGGVERLDFAPDDPSLGDVIRRPSGLTDRAPR